ncbi:MAG: cyclic pyranopterin monophosphate synthase MoaC [Desulfobacterales bacterium CG23_combo_of_CG06-09_8_20_14_all_51_8]|nr:MAG: cyclic pyranopterin monophosphate synthase MoaC [Desulfobacterales bacterium CG23_combo_of_CG06-09_8_20_14_all_51_8]
MSDFTHMDDKGHARMVDISAKSSTERKAQARGKISMTADTFEKIMTNGMRKGNVLETARIAGIMAAKKTWELIPLCHPIQISHVQVNFYPDAEAHSIDITASVKINDRTGVEMEALTAVSVAALTIYDMCKSHDRGMTISDICLVEKSGGKSGVYVRPENSHGLSESEAR